MSNILYNQARTAFLNGTLNWVSNTFTACLVDQMYIAEESHDWLDVKDHVVASSLVFPPRYVTAQGGAAISKAIEVPNVTTLNSRLVSGAVLKRATDDLLVCAFLGEINQLSGVSFTPISASDDTFRLHPDTGSYELFRL